MDLKERYSQFSLEREDIPLFLRGWWLDAVCGKENWDVVLYEKGSSVRGVFVFPKRKRWGYHLAGRVPLTPYSGVWIAPGKSIRPEKKIAHEKKIMEHLLDDFEQLGYGKLEQFFSPAVKNWLPFYWKGYSATLRYTYILQTKLEESELWTGLASNIKGDIKKADKLVSVEESENLRELYGIASLSFSRQSKTIPYTYELLERIDSELKLHKRRKILFARDDHGMIHAALYLVWDDDTAYYLIGGGDPSLRNSGATSLLVWHAIGVAKKLDLSFNFEGSMIESIERFFRAFGGTCTPYFHISKIFSKRLRFFFALRSVVRSIKRQ